MIDETTVRCMKVYPDDYEGEPDLGTMVCAADVEMHETENGFVLVMGWYKLFFYIPKRALDAEKTKQMREITKQKFTRDYGFKKRKRWFFF